MSYSLVIMAAGLGSRYGGNKQTDGIGPNHEMLMEYSLFDALRAGYNKFVFVIKPDMQALIEALCGELLSKRNDIQVHYAIQDFTSLPAFYPVPPQRTKPFGTVHAVLCAEPYIQEPFTVINADDYYGVSAFRTMYAHLQTMPVGAAAMVGYYLKNTVSENGSVSRGVCSHADGLLTAVTETYKIRPFADGTIRDTHSSEEGVSLDPHSLVSMNFWGFHPDIFVQMRDYFHNFLQHLSPDEVKAECLLPLWVDEQLKNNTLSVSVLKTDDVWFGMTYPEDKPFVAQSLKALHDAGVYPAALIK